MVNISESSKRFYEEHLTTYLIPHLKEDEIQSLINNIDEYTLTVCKLAAVRGENTCTDKYNHIMCKVLNALGFFHRAEYYSIVDDPEVNPKYLDIKAITKLDIINIITKHDTFALRCYISKLIDYPSERIETIISFFNYLNIHPLFAIQSIYTKYMKSYLLESGCFKELLYRTDKNSSYVNWSLIKIKRSYNAIVIKLLKRIDQSSDLYSPFIIGEIIKNTSDSIKFLTQLGEKKVVDLTITEKIQTIQNMLNKRANAKVKKGITTHYICSHCHGNECEKTEYQSRSLDESSTTLITCITCKHSWHLN